MEEWKEKYVDLQRSYYGIVQMKISAMMIPDSIIDTQGLQWLIPIMRTDAETMSFLMK